MMAAESGECFLRTLVCRDHRPQPGGLVNNRHLFLAAPEARKSKTKVPASLGKGPLRGSPFPMRPHVVGGARGLAGASSVPILEALPS